MLEKGGELGFSVGDVHFVLVCLAVSDLAEAGDDFAEGEQALVDVDGFFLSDAGCAVDPDSFGASEVDECELGADDGVGIEGFEVKCEDAVRSTRCVVELVRGDYFVVKALSEVVDSVLLCHAFEDK